MADECRARLAVLIPLRDAATTKRERKVLNQEVKMLRGMVAFCVSRVGYVEPTKLDPPAGEADGPSIAGGLAISGTGQSGQ